jgi:hypothetical protein
LKKNVLQSQIQAQKLFALIYWLSIFHYQIRHKIQFMRVSNHFIFKHFVSFKLTYIFKEGNDTYETMSKVMGSKSPLYMDDNDIYGVTPANTNIQPMGKGSTMPIHMPVRARYSLDGQDLTNVW